MNNQGEVQSTNPVGKRTTSSKGQRYTHNGPFNGKNSHPVKGPFSGGNGFQGFVVEDDLLRKRSGTSHASKAGYKQGNGQLVEDMDFSKPIMKFGGGPIQPMQDCSELPLEYN